MCLPEDINKSRFHLKGIQIPVLQFKTLSILVEKYVGYFCEVFEVSLTHLTTIRRHCVTHWAGWLLEWLHGAGTPYLQGDQCQFYKLWQEST